MVKTDCLTVFGRGLAVSLRRCCQRLLCVACGALVTACGAADVDYQATNTPFGAQVEVVKTSDVSALRLFLGNKQQVAYRGFAAIVQDLGPCERLDFGMNAGMYHADFSPVGLYVAPNQPHHAINTERGFGNFFVQPNGVFAWNAQRAVIATTQRYQNRHFAADYATQSGPMLVVDGVINPQFEADSKSFKIRNGVGIKGQTVYFVISKNRLNFHQFARVFKDVLGVEQALYLDGSVSSLYLPQIQRHDRRNPLGPILGLVSNSCP